MLNYIKCLIKVSYSYIQVSFQTYLNIKPLDDSHISLNEILENLSKSIPLNNFAMSYCEFDNNTDIFINIGKYPLDKIYSIGYDIQSLMVDKLLFCQMSNLTKDFSNLSNPTKVLSNLLNLKIIKAKNIYI